MVCTLSIREQVFDSLFVASNKQFFSSVWRDRIPHDLDGSTLYSTSTLITFDSARYAVSENNNDNNTKPFPVKSAPFVCVRST